MRAVILGLAVFALGLATAALVASPRAGARVTGSLSATVGPGFTISMSASTVTAGDYTISVSDNSSIHNFHLMGPGVNMATSISGTGSTTWSVTLQAGTYTFQCDAHAAQMNGTLTVTDASPTTTATTSTSGSTSTATTTTTASTSTATTTTSHTTTAHTTTRQTTSEATTTTEAETTTAAPPTTSTVSTEPEVSTATTTTTPTTTQEAPKPLKAHVAATHATTTSVTITVASNKPGRAVAALFAGARRLAHARGRAPGTLVLRPAAPLAPGRYTVKLRVTAGGQTTTSSREIRVV